MSVSIKPSITFTNATATTQIFISDIVSVQIASASPAVVVVGLTGNATPFSFTAQDSGSAQRIVSQINDALNGFITGAVQIVDTATPTPGMVWTSITPSTATSGLNTPAFTIAGTGFLASGINKLKLDTGTGSSIVYDAGTFAIASDIAINTGPVGANIVAAYTLFYSIDGGASWTTTALTVTFS